MPDSLLSSPLAILIGILCLTACIFIHELGHFLAARWRGAHVPRFSVFGLGNPILKRTWRGVEWCICWIPFGAYVQIPQLADLGEIEGGEADKDAPPRPPLGYLDKVIVAVAGPLFNLLFALVLATVLWVAGEERSAEMATTRIGYVAPTIKLSDGREVPSPAAQAGLQFGDIIRSIDGRRTAEWQDVQNSIVFGAGKTNGERTAVFVVERAGQPLTLTLNPQLATNEKIRRIGVSPYVEAKIHSVVAGSPAAQAGFLAGDHIDAIDGQSIRSFATLDEALRGNAARALVVRVLRSGTPLELTLPAGAAAGMGAKLGLLFTTEVTLVHTDPFTQVAGFVGQTFRTLGSLLNPFSDIGLSKMGGPIGIVAGFTQAAQAGPRVVLWLTILINVALAVFNLLPIPVLDGGHIVFATIAKLRGRAINPEFIAKLQFGFFVLLIAMMLYVSSHDIRRLRREPRPPAEEPAKEQTLPQESPAPAKP